MSASNGLYIGAVALHQLFNESPGYVRGYSRVSMGEGAGVEYWLRCVQTRQVGAFKELPDGNFFIPQQRLSHGGHPVRGIVGWIVFELFHARRVAASSLAAVLLLQRQQSRRMIGPNRDTGCIGELRDAGRSECGFGGRTPQNAAHLPDDWPLSFSR